LVETARRQMAELFGLHYNTSHQPVFPGWFIGVIIAPMIALAIAAMAQRIREISRDTITSWDDLK